MLGLLILARLARAEHIRRRALVKFAHWSDRQQRLHASRWAFDPEGVWSDVRATLREDA